MKIGLIDADLLDNGTRHPNLALMKISAFYKGKKGAEVELTDFSRIPAYDKVFMSKVFDFTKIPINPKDFQNLEWGGTGFFWTGAEDLPYEVEHHMPDYHLYDAYVEEKIKQGFKPQHFSDYMHYSIGFTTRGCFRKCSFCVNQKYDRVFRHSPVMEFFDPSRKYIYLWDDNFLGYGKWQEVFDELEATNRRFQFRQGLDIRLINQEKACRLARSKYHGDFIFAFDHLEDREEIERGLQLWRKHSNKTTKLYVFCGFESQGAEDIFTVFERIKILMRYQCVPYIMRHKNYEKSEYAGIYITLARWCNQPNFFKKKSFREFCEANGLKSSAWKYLVEFEKGHSELAKKYFDMKFEHFRT